MKLKTQQLSSLEQVRAFMAGTDAVPFTTQAHQDRYQWMTVSLKRFAYERLRRAERGLIVRFLCKVTGYSRAQVTRLIAQWRCRGRLSDRRGPPAAPFAKRYGALELRLLAQIDSLTGASFFEVGGVCTAVVDWHRGAPLPSTPAVTRARRFCARRGKLRGYAATSTYSTRLSGRGISVPSSRIPSRWNSMASRICASASSTVAPVATQPGKSGTYAE